MPEAPTVKDRLKLVVAQDPNATGATLLDEHGLTISSVGDANLKHPAHAVTMLDHCTKLGNGEEIPVVSVETNQRTFVAQNKDGLTLLVTRNSRKPPASLPPVKSEEIQITIREEGPINANDSNEIYDAIIIGAGLAGCSAANQIIEANENAKILILEGSNRIGGRLRSIDFYGKRVEEGANWVQGLKGNPIWDLAQKKKLNGKTDGCGVLDVGNEGSKNDDDDDDDEDAENDDKNKDESVDESESEDENIQVFDENGENITESALSRFEQFDEAFEVKRKQVIAHKKIITVGQGDTDMRSLLGNSEIGEKIWETPENSLDTTVENFRLDFEYGEAAGKTSAYHNLIEEFTAEDFGEGSFLVDDERGFETICEIDEKVYRSGGVKFNTKAEKLELINDDYIKVHCNEGKNTEITNFSAKFVICTASVGVLNSNSIDFSPTLSEAKVKNLSSMTMCSYTKIFVRLKGLFWWNFFRDKSIDSDKSSYILRVSPDKKFSVWQAVETAVEDGKNQGDDDFSTTVVATLTGEEGRWAENELADDLGKLREEVAKALFTFRTDEVKADSKYFEKLRDSEIVAAHVCKWNTDPLFKGAYSFLPVGSLENGAESWKVLQEAEMNDRLHFAGEAFHARYSGYLQGAYLSGKDVGKGVAVRLESNRAIVDPKLTNENAQNR